MTEPDDHQLLAEFARGNSEAAFAALVSRHINLVYSTALRSVGNTHAAEEITQAVFIILARKANNLSRKIVLSGWLYQTARLTAANFLRTEIRRQKREQEAYMQSTLNEPKSEAWRQIAPLLDDALSRLGEKDRNAVVLRFFENKNLHDVGLALGASEDAAKMRVNRALEKLRKFFTKHGATFSVAIIASAVSANSVQAAPVGLAAAISATAMKSSAVAASTLTLVKGALKIMAWTKMKTTIVAGAVVLLAAGTTTLTVKTISEHIGSNSWRIKPYFDSRILDKSSPQVKIVPTKFPGFGGMGWSGNPHKMMGLGATVNRVVEAAWDLDFGDYRIIYSSEMPPGRYDFIASLASGNAEALRQEIKKQIGLVGHVEMIETNVLLLEVKSSDAPGLVRSSKQNGMSAGNGMYKSYGQTISNLAAFLENQFEIPVIDRTDLKGGYDIDLKWQDSNDLKQKLVDELGLELVPTHMPIEMLVVEKTN